MAEDPRYPDVLRNLEKLVKCLVGKDLPNVKLNSLLHYAVHKVRNHRYLSINSHEVSRSVENLVDRFHYEGLMHQARAVRFLCSVIMNHGVWKDHYEVDVQYSILDFLLHMAYEPIQMHRRNRLLMEERLLAIRAAIQSAPAFNTPEFLTKPNPVEFEINWGAYLREDLIPIEPYDSDSTLSDWSEETSSEESSYYEPEQEAVTSLDQKEMAIVYANCRAYPIGTNTYVPAPQRPAGQKKTTFTIIQPEYISFSGIQSRHNWCTLPKLKALEPPRPPIDVSNYSVDHMAKAVHSHWWRDDINVHTLTPTKNPCANFAIAHVQHMNRYSRSLIKQSLPKTVNEMCLLREIIFMFFEPVDCCFFEVRPEKLEISVRSNVSICSVSHGTLKSTLDEEVQPALQAMYRLRQLVKDLLRPTGGKTTTGTLECFAGGLRDLMQPIVQQLLVFERRLLDKASGKNESGVTLIGLVLHMREQFKQLQELQLVASDAVVDAPPHLRSAYLLTKLYRHTRMHVTYQKMVTALLLMTLRRFCEISDNWWRHAELNDSRLEFIVEYSSADGQGICERRLPEDAPQQHKAILAELQHCEFYRLLITYAMESGETQELLAIINLLGDLVNSTHQLRPLHDDLIRQYFDELKIFAGCAQPKGRRRESILNPSPHKLSQFFEQTLMATARVGDRRLIGMFNQHIRSDRACAIKMEQEPVPLQVLDILEALEKCTKLQLPQVMPRALSKVLRQRCDQANQYMMHWYREELVIADHVHFLRHVLMFQADYIMYPFYISLFRQIESGQNWASSSDLTTELYDILDRHYPNMACELYVEVISRSRAHSLKVYEALNAIAMAYMMSPALDRIITANQMLSYNRIWRLMLKVKWAIWKLENMHFIKRKGTEVYGPLDLVGLTVRRLEILRFWLISMISSLHTHLCTHVLQAIGAHFEEQLPKVFTIRELAKLHEEYLDSICKHCLLTEEFDEFHSALEQIFHLIFVLDMEWNSCGNYLNVSHALSLDISSDNTLSLDEADSYYHTEEANKAMEYLALNQVGEIESTYIRCHQMMAGILTNLVYKHDQKFLNSLEVAISSSLPC
ncbi:uncharacterized protein LOC6585250 [Drosophila mojavensis]|uniref:Gamma-tubulin complex component n=1 Tax=Drosophila mojavensis TaxID=7230 RepID=B4L5S9_DROMO|nr:uncharacterized protein LOC6585250 [Drosophila mojavensis]EDW06538.1 uncharacterized protein Dmoj_GI21792 [Drosophila mojavensis]